LDFEEKELRFRLRSWQVNVVGRAPSTTIIFIPFSGPLRKLETEWEQAHDQYHDWITIHRGRCLGCGTTFTFLPLLSLPYTHYSLLARVQTLRRRFEEHCSWEQATPTLQDSNRVPDPSTLRRWSHDLDSSQPALSFLRQTLAHLVRWLKCGDQADDEACLLSWLTPVLQILWRPLRL
jgi:hypothetical protein